MKLSRVSSLRALVQKEAFYLSAAHQGFCPLAIRLKLQEKECGVEKHISARCPVSPLSGSYFVMLFPSRYLFPRQLLVKHFWTPKQQIDFLDIYHSLRKQSHSEIIAYLERASALVSDERLRWHLTDVCTKVLLQPSLSPDGCIAQDLLGAADQGL